MRGLGIWLSLFELIAACGSSGRAAAPPQASSTQDAGAKSASAKDAGTADPCSADALREPRAATTYYVAAQQPGASNTACDGLSPTDEGGGHCPFADFSSPTTRALLDGVKSTRVEVREGTYTIDGWDGLRVTGTGQSEAERVVLSAHPGEHPVLDVAAPDGGPCTAANAKTTPQCVREVVRISGTYTLVQGLTIQNGLAYHAEITGGMHHVFRCNTLRETVAFAMRSDQLKLDGSATDVQVLHNDFSKFRSQAVDMAQVFDVLVEDNEFHDPIDANAGATGAKFGVRNITIRNNRVHDLGDDPSLHAFSLGGTGSAHADDAEAYAVHVEGNHVWNLRGKVAQIVSCQQCSFTDNVVWDVAAGVHLSGTGTGGADCSGSATGCLATHDAIVTGNRMRGLSGGGNASQANVFVYVDDGEQTGLIADDNLYCAASAQDARFGWSGMLLGLDAWRTASGTDASSVALASTDPRCTAF